MTDPSVEHILTIKHTYGVQKGAKQTFGTYEDLILGINYNIKTFSKSSKPFVLFVSDKSLGGHNLSPLVEIGLTDLPKSGGAMATPVPPIPPGPTPLTLASEPQPLVRRVEPPSR